MRTIKEALDDGSLSLEDEIDYADMTEDEYKQEIERLNNIINELEKYLIEYSQDLEFRCYANMFLDKLQELKGVDKE